MNRILVILTINTENLPENFQEIIKHEREVVAKWKEGGFLDQLFLRQTRNGAVFIFKDLFIRLTFVLLPSSLHCDQ